MSFSLFDRDSKLLPGFCRPYPDEVLSCWLTRMAYHHGMGLKQFFKHIWPEYGIKQDIDRYITKDQIGTLASVTNCTYEDVLFTTLRYYENSLFKYTEDRQLPENWLLHGTRHTPQQSGTYHSSGLMFCPKCLEGNGRQIYFKKQWRLALSFVCITCGCYLVDLCPYCHRGNTFLDVPVNSFPDKSLDELMVNCHTCGKPLTDCDVEYATESLISLQQRLYHLIGKGMGKRAEYTQSYFNVLYYLSSAFLIDNQRIKAHRKLIDHVMNIHGLNQDVIRPYNARYTKRLPAKKRAIVISLAYWLLEDWPKTLVNICNETCLASKDLFSLILRPPDWFTEPLERKINLVDLSEITNPNEEEDYDDKGFGGEDDFANSYIIRANDKPTLRMDYDIDLNDKYYTNTDGEYYAYDDLELYHELEPED